MRLEQMNSSRKDLSKQDSNAYQPTRVQDALYKCIQVSKGIDTTVTGRNLASSGLTFEE